MIPPSIKPLLQRAAHNAQSAATSLVIAQSWVDPIDGDDDRDPVAMLGKHLDDALTHAMDTVDQVRHLRSLFSSTQSNK
jgi:hypothetical protein